MPKAKKDREGKSPSTSKQPYSRCDEAPKPKRRKQNCANEEAQPVDDVRKQKNINYDPGSPENTLKCFMKHHKASLEATKKETAEIVEKMHQTKLAYAELNQENVNLKKRISDIEKTKQELENKSKILNDENKLLLQKCSHAKDQCAFLETRYDAKLAALHYKLGEQQRILFTNDVEKSELQCQLTEKDKEWQLKMTKLEALVGVKELELQTKITELLEEADKKAENVMFEKRQTEQKFCSLLQQKEEEHLSVMKDQKILIEQQHFTENLELGKIINQLESSLRTQENQLAEMQLKNTQLELHNNELHTAFELKKEEMAQKFEQVAQLKVKELIDLQAELQQKNADFAQAIEENAQRVKTIAELETLLKEKANQMLEMQLKLTEHEKLNTEMQKALEDEKQLVAGIQSKEFAELKKELSELQVLLQQQTTACSQQLEEIGQHEAKMQLMAKKLEESEKNSLELKQQNEKLTEEAQTAMQQANIKMQRNQNYLDTMHTTMTEIETRENKYQAYIEELKEANAQLLNNLEQEFQARQDYEKLMQQNHLNITNKLKAENTELSQQLATFTELQEKKLMELQEMLQQKEADIAGSKQDYADLERQKNSTIAELKYKMTQIGNVFSQPMGRATPLKKAVNNQPVTPLIELLNENEAEAITRPVSVASVGAVDKFNNSTGEMAATLPVTSRPVRRRQLKRPAYQADWSDFNSDTDGTECNWKPKPKKSSKISKIQGVAPQIVIDAFDQLKQT